jgi:hypothetical protein
MNESIESKSNRERQIILTRFVVLLSRRAGPDILGPSLPDLHVPAKAHIGTDAGVKCCGSFTY